MTIGKRILHARSEAKLTQAQLSKIVGVTRGAVAQWERGTVTPRPNIIEKIANATKKSKEWLLVGDGYIAAPLPSQSNARMVSAFNLSSSRRIPVYGQAVGGVYGEFPFNGEVLYDIPCPPRLEHITGAYALIVSGDNMSPRYEDGEMIYVDPSRRVTRGNYVVVQLYIEGNAIPHAFVKRLIKHDAIEIVLEQFNPPKQLRFSHEKVVSVHYIAMSGDAL